MTTAKTISILILFLICIHPVLSFSKIYTIEIPEINHRENSGTHDYFIPEFGSTMEEYKPNLPMKTYYYEVPMDAEIRRVQLVQRQRTYNRNIENLKENLPPMPSNFDTSYRPPSRDMQVQSVYPRRAFTYNGIKILNGKKLVSVTVYPVRYDERQSLIEFTNQYKFLISYRGNNRQGTRGSRPSEMLAAGIISNYEELRPQEIATGDLIASSSIPGTTAVKYAIITTSAFESAMQDLADWKSTKGIPAKVYITTDIYNSTNGTDNAEKIRNFLIELEETHDLDWVVIGGDTGDVPVRSATVPDEYAPDGTLVPTDYYYADLQGDYAPYDWDKDNDSLYGEIADDIDWLPEAYVGRMSPANAVGMQTMVDNVINYEKNPNAGSWTSKAILAGAESDTSTDEALLMEYVRQDFMNTTWTTDRVYYHTNYTRDYLLSFANLETQLDLGASVVNWAGHGSTTSAAVTQVGPSFVSTSTSPSNSAKRPVVYANSCSTGRFDSTCLGEDIIRDWGMGFAGASRVSWYIVGWSGPWQGMNQGADYRFFEQLLGEKKFSPGQAFYDSKVDYITDFDSTASDPDTGANALYSRKNLMAYNYLGDPELNVWTDTPGNLTIAFDEFFRTGLPNIVTVNVTDGGSPVVNATVCAQNGNDTYDYGITDATGIVELNFTTQKTIPVTITATKHNYIPEQSNMSLSGLNVSLLSPIDQEFINPSSIIFTYQVTTNTTVNSCSLIADGVNVSTETSVISLFPQNITWENPLAGSIDWGMDCIDSTGKRSSLTTENILVTAMTGFDGNSTNLTDVDIENVTNFTIDKQVYGMIKFITNVNLSGTGNINSHISIQRNSIEIDTSALPQLNASAQLTIRGIIVENPVIYRDGSVCDDCAIVDQGYDYVIFNVSHFTLYTVGGSPVEIVKTGQLTETAAGSSVGQGANVTMMNLSATVSTDRWQGFFGNVSGSVQIGLGFNIFYDFGTGTVQYVYASQNQSFDFDSLEAAAAADIDTVWNYAGGNDQAIDIYVDTTDISGITAPSAEMEPVGQNLNSTALDDSNTGDKGSFAFGALVQSGATCFDGTVCDYELLVPADGIETYYMFVEIG